MASPPSSVCGICSLRNLTKKSEVWCPECDEGLCSHCMEHHSLSKLSRDHITVPVTEYSKLPKEVVEISLYCKQHHEKYQTFCRKHDCPCCRKCIIESHNDCKDLKTIDEVVTNVKSSSAFYEIEETLAEVSENLVKIRKNRQENLASITENRNKIETEIKELRIRINKHLDKIQEDMTKELQTVEENQRKEIQKLLAAIEQNEFEIKDVQTTISNIKQHASDLQAFLTLKQIDSKASEKQAFVQSLLKDNGINDVVLTSTMDETIRAFESTILTFGKVNVEERPSNIATTFKKESQAQTMVENKTFEIENLKLTLHERKNANLFGIFGCHLFTDGRIVITGADGLKIINTNGLFQKMDLVNTANDVTSLENDVIAVTTARSVKVININKKQVLKTILCASDCYGISSKNGNLIICTCKGIRLLKWQNEQIYKISNVKLPAYAFVATYLDYIYFTNNETDTVTCCDQTGTTLWQFRDTNILSGPIGISVDSNGSIYVAGGRSHNVVVISRDGKQHRQLLTKQDGLLSPWALYFEQSANQLLVANFKNDVFLYDAS